MDCVAVFLLLLAICFSLAIAVISRFRQRRGRRHLFMDIARQFSGTYTGGGLFGRPHVRLRYGETLAVISEGLFRGPLRNPTFQVRMAWPHAHVRCELIARAPRRRPGELLLTWPRISIEGTELTDSFLVSGWDEREVRQLLTSGVCWQLERLRLLGEDSRLYVSVRDGQIVVQKFWRRPRRTQPTLVVRTALDLYDQFMLAKASGIEFLHTDEAQSLGEVICKICGESIADDLVFCRRCKTPHHEECWQYAGICSVFGCRETVYHVPRDGRMIAPPPEIPRPPAKPR